LSVRAENVCPPAPAGHARCAAELLRLRRAVRVASARARATSVASPGPPKPYTAAYLQQAYDLTYLSATRGSADTVAVVDAYDDRTAALDLAKFRADNGLPPCTVANGCLRKVNEWGAPAPLPPARSGWQFEAATDLAAVSALCPNCHILLVEAASTLWSDLVRAMQAAAQMGANQISDSWTTTDSSQPPGQVTFPGVAVIAATGDSGFVSAGEAYPAAAPGVTAAGGTSLQPAAGAGNLRGFVETAWSGAGSGCATDIPKPAFQSTVKCAGRAYADVSADADPSTGLAVYESGAGGWTLAGGTSLSAPLIAAFEAVTGVDGTTPAWAYAGSARLNDPAAGSNGTCVPALTALCVGGIGYDGPTGAGSISGQVVSGAPGIGADGAGAGAHVRSPGARSAALLGGVYPNGLDTTAWWQYGTGTTYGRATAPIDIGHGTAIAPVAGQLAGLQPSTAYHYRLVAHNADGTSYGYDYALATSTAPANPGGGRPRATATDRGSRSASSSGRNGAAWAELRPRLAGRAAVRSLLIATLGSSRVRGQLVFAWQVRQSGQWVMIPRARSARYVPTRSEVGHRLRVLVSCVTGGRHAGGASAASAPVAPRVA
jgi:hypothetical protein